MQDRNFDDIAEKFAHNIYGTTKGKVRQAVLWQDLERLLSQMPQRPLYILDAGGGEGYISGQLAQLGHQVVLCDLSSEMLQRATLLAEQRGVRQNMHFIQSSVQDIAQHLARPVDLILFHAVLEWVAEPQQALGALYNCLLPGGVFSVMFFNADALLMRNALLGNFRLIDPAVKKRRKRSLLPLYPRHPPEVYRWLEQLGLQISGKTGVRVFHDYLQDKKLQKERFDELLALEMRYCRQEPYVSLGRYIHVVAHKLT